MINNGGVAGIAVLVVACNGARADLPEGYQGVVELEERTLGFEVGGRLVRVPAREGATVEAGTELAALDDELDRIARDARVAERDRAQAALDLLLAGVRREEVRATTAELEAARTSEVILERTLERQRGLQRNGAVGVAALDDLEAQLAQARARRQGVSSRLSEMRTGARDQEIRAARAQLEAASAAVAGADARVARSVLRADAPGTVLDVHAEPNEIVAPGAPVVTVADVDRPYVDVFVPQGEIDRVSIGAHARIATDALDRDLEGEVEDIGRRTEFTPRFLFSERERPNLVVRVRVRVDDPDHRLTAGVPAFVTVGRGGDGQ